MDAGSETRPLLPSFQGESWRSRTRKRCMRIPSEVTITGIILGLFVVVVTLLIVFENVENEKKDDITLDSKLLASPFKYNKKAEDTSWQDKKTNIKNKKGNKELKWDNVNKGWKEFPDVSGKIKNTGYEIFHKNLKSSLETSELPEVVDEYGKELDNSWETYHDLQMSDPVFQDFNKETSELKRLLHSKIKFNEIDDGWKELSEQGWSERTIRSALFKAIKEKRKELIDAANTLQSPMNFETIWDNIIAHWKKNVKDGNTDEDDLDKQYGEILESPKSSFKKMVKDDEGWKKLSDQGWKNKDIEEAVVEAWKDQQIVSQSPMNLNIQSVWGKITAFFKNLFQNDMGQPKSQKEINDKWANKFNLLQSSLSSYNKIEDLKKKHSKDDSKDKIVDEPEDVTGESTTSNISFEDFIEDIIKIINKKGTDEQKSQKEINDEWANKFSLLQSPMPPSKKWGEVEDLRKMHPKNGMGDKTQKEIFDEYPNEYGLLLSQWSHYKKWKKIQDLKNRRSKEGGKNNTDTNDTEHGQVLQAPMKFEDFMEDIIERFKKDEKEIKEAEKQKDINGKWKNGLTVLQTAVKGDKRWKQVDDHWRMRIEHERNEYSGRNDGDVTSGPKNMLQQSMPFDNAKEEKIAEQWKKLTGKGWKDKDIREAIVNAWNDGHILLQSAMGQNNDYKWKKVNEGWKKVNNKSISFPTRCPFSKFHKDLQLGSPMSAAPIDCSLVTEEVRRKFGRCIDLSFLPKECKPSWREKCFSTYKYRKIDGTCNNKIHPTWGQSGTPFVRMLAPDYADGVSALRTATDGGPLPNARLLSRKLYSKQMKPNSDTSVLFLYFGLFVDHDMVETAVDSDSIPCCAEDFLANRQSRPKECLQIDIPSDDPFYGPKDVQCLNLVRSIPVNGVCGGRREQLNKATSFLDGSVVYGSAMGQAKQLRFFSRGQLKTQLINNTPFMSIAEGVGYSCGTTNEPLKCFQAGDSRVNMMVELTAMHTLWHREHNRIANELHKLNPQWRDEILYQEARRILIGEFQHITYSEFLPILLGENAVEDYEIKIDDGKIYEGYDETIDPSVFNVFGAAAFRFGHSIVPDMQFLLGVNNSTVSKVPLHETFFNAKLLYHNGLDLLLRGAAEQRTQSVDSYISPEVREHLFQPENLDYGYDLAAVGIQRGRDHGLPPYVKWRSVCGLPDVKTWDDLYNVMDKERADMFKSVYKSVEDIDLIPGALAENHERESQVGPTYTCLIGRQFKKTRKGDRFWFEIQNETGSFSKGQLDQIYKSNMARIICDNSDGIKSIQRNPFKVPSSLNPILDCDGIQKLDLSEWRSNI